MKQFGVITGVATFLAAALLRPVYADFELSFGVYTSNKPTEMVRKFRPVLNALEKPLAESLGTPVRVRIQVAKNYTQGIEHLASGKVDFSRFGPASYVEAKRSNPDISILASEGAQGDKVTYGIICVQKDSPIKTVEELKGKSFAFGSEQSTIGRYLSQQYLRNHGIHASDLSRYDYLGRHDKVGTEVGAGNFDGGALNESTYNKLLAKGVPIRELARFPNVAKPWIARSDLPERVFNALQLALLTMTDPGALKALKTGGFFRGADSDYAAIRDAIEHNGLFFRPSSRSSQPDPSSETRAEPRALELTENGAANREAERSHAETMSSKSAQGEPAASETAKSEAAGSELAKVEPVKGEPAPSTVAASEPAKSEAVEGELAETDAVKSARAAAKRLVDCGPAHRALVASKPQKSDVAAKTQAGRDRSRGAAIWTSSWGAL